MVATVAAAVPTISPILGLEIDRSCDSVLPTDASNTWGEVWTAVERFNPGHLGTWAADDKGASATVGVGYAPRSG